VAAIAAHGEILVEVREEGFDEWSSCQLRRGSSKK